MQNELDCAASAGRSWKFVAVLLAMLAAMVLMAKSGNIRNWWDHRHKQSASIESMSLQKGDIRLRDVGGCFSDRKFYLQIAMDNELPIHRVGGVNEGRFDVKWEVAIVVDDEQVHTAEWKGSPKPVLLFGSLCPPRFDSVQAYVDNGATVRVNIRQNGSDIPNASKSLVEK